MFKIVMLMVLVINSFGNMLPYNKECVAKVHNTKVNQKRVNEIVRDLEYLDYKQLSILGLLYEKCSEYNLENTCMAIGYKESKLGKYLFNPKTGDYGIMGINLRAFSNGNAIDFTYWSRLEFASKLMVDNELNIALAIENIEYWRRITNNDWRLIWGSYNSGWKPSTKYTTDMLNTIKAFKVYFKKHPDVYNLIRK